MADDQEREELHESVRGTEDDLLRSAFAPKEEKSAPEPEPKPEPKAEPEARAAEPETPKERIRDEKGRFAPQVARTGPETAPPGIDGQQPAIDGQQKPEEQVPSWRLREINEERRQLQAERDQLRAEQARTQAYLEQMRRQQAPPQEPQLPDPVLDPAGYTKALQENMRREFAQQQAADRLNFNLEMTHMRYGERFEKAFEQIISEGQRGNQQLVRHITSQPNPGEALMRWFTQNQVMAEVGPDPAAYQKKVREQLLNDPEFLAQAEQTLRERAMGGGQQRPNTVVKMPPSLSKATGTSETMPTHTDGSEAALFNYAMTSPRRR